MSLKRIKNYIVQEIALVKKAANQEKKFLLLKYDLRKQEQGGNFKMEKDVEMTFERTEELSLPPDVVNAIKEIIGKLSKLIGYKYKAKYTYKKPAKGEGDETEIEDAELSAYTDCMKKQMKAGKSMAQAAKICKVKAKKGEEEDEELDEELSAYTDCMKAQMKAGKSMAQAAKICKVKIKEGKDAQLHTSGGRVVDIGGDGEVAEEIVETLTDVKEALKNPKFTKEQKVAALEKAISEMGGE
ncbi:MAG: hypothetical protein ACTSR2_06220 [Candidatus Hodarchaeales archaeon]